MTIDTSNQSAVILIKHASLDKKSVAKPLCLISVCVVLLQVMGQATSADLPGFLVIRTPEDARSFGLDSLRLAIEDDGGVPLPENIERFVTNPTKAVELGKALFWDMQVGSDGIQACASCHFHAGADSRKKNQVNPNFTSFLDSSEGDIQGYLNGLRASDINFEFTKPNEKLRRRDFPLVKEIQSLLFFDDLTVRPGAGNSNDVVASMGMHFSSFGGVVPGEAVDQGFELLDPVWNINGTETVRRSEPRNAPSVINAVFNYTNFWDGRASPHFNGQSSAGDLDPNAIIVVKSPGAGLAVEQISLDNASLASQALQPVNNPFEMAFGDGQMAGRNFPELGTKLLRSSALTGEPLRPLGRQYVHQQDSVLGALSRRYKPGLDTTYLQMIQEAFAREFWDSTETIDLPGGISYTQMEFNFSLFFGLSVALYEATLVSDLTPFDRWMESGRFNRGFKKNELKGLNLFVDKANCLACHEGPEFTQASIRRAGIAKATIGARQMTDGAGLYDLGFHNIAVTPTTDDVGRGDRDGFGSPLAYSRKALLERLQLVTPSLRPISGNEFIPSQDEDIGALVCADPDGNGYCETDDPINDQFQRVSVDGAFKTPGLRNVELTGPYFHNGGMSTLRQTVQFYNRGGNFCAFNNRDLHSAIVPLELSAREEKQLVAFMVSLTDPRVKFRSAPFDHPALHLPIDGRRSKGLHSIRAVGAYGSNRPLRTFLGLDPNDATFTPSGECSINLEHRR